MTGDDADKGFPLVSALALVLVNLYPIYGVLRWDWDVFPLFFLYWAENLIIGIYTIAKMVAVAPRDGSSWGEKLIAVPFFLVHYGGFLAFHGLFVISFFGGELYPEYLGYWPTPQAVARIVDDYGLQWVLAFLFLSHGTSFLFNFLRGREYRRTNVKALWFSPYGRVIVLHVTILGCGFLLEVLGSPFLGLVLLIVLKTLLDLWGHLRERRKLAGRETMGGG